MSYVRVPSKVAEDSLRSVQISPPFRLLFEQQDRENGETLRAFKTGRNGWVSKSPSLQKTSLNHLKNQCFIEFLAKFRPHDTQAKVKGRQDPKTKYIRNNRYSFSNYLTDTSDKTVPMRRVCWRWPAEAAG